MSRFVRPVELEFQTKLCSGNDVRGPAAGKVVKAAVVLLCGIPGPTTGLLRFGCEVCFDSSRSFMAVALSRVFLRQWSFEAENRPVQNSEGCALKTREGSAATSAALVDSSRRDSPDCPVPEHTVEATDCLLTLLAIEEMLGCLSDESETLDSDAVRLVSLLIVLVN